MLSSSPPFPSPFSLLSCLQYLPPSKLSSSSTSCKPRSAHSKHLFIYIYFLLFGMIGLCIFLFCGCRVCYLKTKQGWVQCHRAATTNATSATHAWRFRCRHCPVKKQLMLVLVLIPWRSTMAHLR